MCSHPTFNPLKGCSQDWVLVTGPSGCGKSTLVEDLKFEGLERISIDGDWFGHRDKKKRWDWNHDGMKWLRLTHPYLIWVGACDKLFEFAYLFDEIYVLDVPCKFIACQGVARDIEQNRDVRPSFEYYYNDSALFYEMCKKHDDWHFCTKAALFEILLGRFSHQIDQRAREALGNRVDLRSYGTGPSSPFFDPRWVKHEE